MSSKANISARNFLTSEEQSRVKEAIVKAELQTSGEIRVHIEDSCNIDIYDRAVYVFEKLGMHKTALRNGVLIYLAVKSRAFVIIGDAGINALVGQQFWDEEKELMQQRFLDGRFADGLCEAVLLVGLRLGEYFPLQKGDVNELSDDISYSD